MTITPPAAPRSLPSDLRGGSLVDMSALEPDRGGWPGRLAAPGRGLLLAGLAIAASAVACVVTFAGCLLFLVVGVYLVPGAVGWLRGIADVARRSAGRWSGVPIPAPYLPDPPAAPGFRGRVQRNRALLSDPATWRDLLWSLVDPYMGALLARCRRHSWCTASSAWWCSRSSGARSTAPAGATGTPPSTCSRPARRSPRYPSASYSSWSACSPGRRCCGCMRAGPRCCSRRPGRPSCGSGWTASPGPAPPRPTTRPPNCAGSNATCTTAHRPDWSRWG